MRKVWLAMAAVLVLSTWSDAWADDVPNLMTTQGVLRNLAGDVVNGKYALTFRFWDAKVDGELLWSELQNNVAVTNGIYTVVLGKINPFQQSLFKDNAAIWMGISVEGEEELPRVRITSVAYSLHARTAATASDLECTGCIEEGMLGFDPVTEGGSIEGDLEVEGSVTATAYFGDGSNLTGIVAKDVFCAAGWFVTGLDADGNLMCQEVGAALTSVDGLDGGTINGDVEVTGALSVDGNAVCHEGGNCPDTLSQLACDDDQVAMWSDDAWECSDVEMNPDILPADGLDEISNDLLFNQFTDVYDSGNTPVDIKDFYPPGITDEVTIPNVGTAQTLIVSINISNSNLEGLEVYLYDPNGDEYVLYDKGGPGTQLGKTYPVPDEPVSGDLTKWVGQNPAGIWYLKVVDSDFIMEDLDGKINNWSITVKTLSNQKVLVDGDLVINGTITGPDGLELPGNASVEGSLKIGEDDGDCDGDKEGSIRYSGSRLEWCDGDEWHPFYKPATYRWAVFDTNQDGHEGWLMNNQKPELFGGGQPSQWTDGNFKAHQMSSDKEVLRTLFNKKGYAVKNANVWSEVYSQYSSTTGKVAMTLFRIKNTTDQPITWQPSWYFTAYTGWSETASVALNGSNVWHGNCGGSTCSRTESISIPADRTSTVIFVSTSSQDYYPGYHDWIRKCVLVFHNDTLDLPEGLRFVDDLDTATGGWDQ